MKFEMKNKKKCNFTFDISIVCRNGTTTIGNKRTDSYRLTREITRIN